VRRIRHLVAAWALLAGGPAAATDYPFSAIGKVITPSGAVCSGTAIAPTKVLTAAHCLVNRSGTATFRPLTVHFAAGLDADGVAQYVKSAEIALAPGYDPTRKDDYGNAARDWAILTVEAPITVARGGIPLLGGTVPRSDLVSLAYSRAHRVTPRVQTGCRIVGDDPPLLLHSCPVEPGASGGPILTGQGPDAALVAIHIATVSVNGERTGIALPVSAMALDLRPAKQP